MKKLLLFAVILLSGCELINTKCWKCELKYLDLKSQKLLAPVDTIKSCGDKPMEFNGQFTHEKFGVVRKLYFCEQ